MKDNGKADSELMDIRQNTFEITILLDFYGQLLTIRQFEILDLHYNSDLSLGEISDELGITRQAAHDSIRKGKATLLEYEERLGLIKRFRTQEDSIRSALASLKRLEQSVDGIGDNQHFIKARKTLDDIMETL